MSLYEVITENQTVRSHPFLEDKFRLAHSLAEAVYYFHQVGWLHKRLGPSNIMFFVPPAPQTKVPKGAEEIILVPYIVGFSHSRPNERDHFTELSNDPRNQYSHPDYISKESEGFRQEYDYYSLGLILYEIGNWYPVAKGSRSMKRLTVKQRRDQVLEKLYVLRRTMGNTYYQAVETCLANDWASKGQASDPGHNERVRKDFHKLVVCRLQDAYRRLAGTASEGD